MAFADSASMHVSEFRSARRASESGRLDSSAEMLTTFRTVVPPRTVEEMQGLAAEDPVELTRWMLSPSFRADAVLLSDAAEALAFAHQSGLVLPLLLDLSRHARPFVRESAIVGMVPHLGLSLAARDRIREMAASDPSPGVKTVAQDVVASL